MPRGPTCSGLPLTPHARCVDLKSTKLVSMTSPSFIGFFEILHSISFDMKMCTYFLFFSSAHSDKATALSCLELTSA